MRLFAYKMTHDTGFAPNPFWGWMTLATCKSQIRRCKYPGDWIAGFTSRTLCDDPVGGERLVFLMQVQEKMTLAEYFGDGRFRSKIPRDSRVAHVHSEGDNIYRPLVLNAREAHHFEQLANPNHTAADHDDDVNGGYVLISKRFVYFGVNALRIPPHARPEVPARQWGRRVEGRTRQNRDTEPIAAARPAEEARYEFSVEQWDRLRPALDRVFLAVRRELRPGQNLLREFVKVVRKAFVKGGGSKLAAREACVRWNRETRGGRDVEVADIGPHRPGTMCLEQEPSSRNPTISPWQAACLPSREVDPAGIPWYTLKRSRELLRCLLPRGAAGSLPAQPSFSGDSMSSAWPTLLRGAGIVVIPQPGPSSAHRNRRSLVNRPTAERLGYPSFSYVHALPAHFSTP